jgi:hypothetical protein
MDHLGRIVYPKRQQAVARTEDGPAIRRIIGGRYGSCIPWLQDQSSDPVHQRVERRPG